MKASLAAVAAALFLQSGQAGAQGVLQDIRQEAPGLTLTRDGEDISSHADERNALEAALKGPPGTYRVRRSDIVIVTKPVPLAFVPACFTGRCDTTPEAIALRRHLSRDATTAWVAAPTNRAKMRWPDQATLDANMATWRSLP